MEEKFNNDQEERQFRQFQEYQKRQEDEKKKKRKKGWLFGCGGCLVLLILIIVGISACTATITGGSNNDSDNKTHKMGEKVKNGDLEVTVNSVETKDSVGSQYAPTTPKGTFVVANVTIKNNGNKALTVDSNMFTLKYKDKSYDADSGASMSANQSDDGNIENSFFLEQVNPDSTTEGYVVFDVSDKVANTEGKKLEITSSLFSSKGVTFDLSE